MQCIGLHFHMKNFIFLDKPTIFFDYHIDESLSLSPEQFHPVVTAPSFYFAVDTKIPYLSFFQSFSRRSLSIIPKQFYHMKDKIKDIASQLGG